MNSLGFNKDPSATRVVVAMSGGVDSSVVAGMLHKQGYQVIGITLQLYSQDIDLQKKGACCAGQDIYDAKRVASDLGFPHYVLDFEKTFKKDVIESFADSYMHGETPIPCVKCNQTVKFRDLYAYARELGADCMATGHYVQRNVNNNKAELYAGADVSRDQSFFLFGTTQEQLDFLRFPLGGIDKTETRAIAHELGLALADKPDSQDICFVPNGSYANLVAKMRPGTLEPGNIVDLDGKVYGQHKGIIYYTIGQRKGLDIGGLKDPLYVIDLRAESHEVVVGPKEALSKSSIHLRDINWLDERISHQAHFNCGVKIRSTQQAFSAEIVRHDAYVEVLFDEPQYGVAPGQACVFYEGSRVLGGGWIV